jgi:hypothetical protein
LINLRLNTAVFARTFPVDLVSISVGGAIGCSLAADLLKAARRVAAK